MRVERFAVERDPRWQQSGGFLHGKARLVVGIRASVDDIIERIESAGAMTAFGRRAIHAYGWR
jgi:hypothetical protein